MVAFTAKVWKYLPRATIPQWKALGEKGHPLAPKFIPTLDSGPNYLIVACEEEPRAPPLKGNTQTCGTNHTGEQGSPLDLPLWI